jgi:uroporphyrinogen-III synthase
MRLIVTRPRSDGERTQAALFEAGHRGILAPLFEIHLLSGPTLALAGASALIATSANAVQALAARSQIRNLPLFVVGPHSAAVARDEGFTTVLAGNGGADGLLPQILNRLPPAHSVLFHAAPAQSAGTLEAELSRHGYTMRREVLYEARAARTLPHAAAESLSAGSADGVLFYSPRSARVFARLVTDAGLAPRLRGLQAFCISTNTAQGLGQLPFAARRIAPQSDHSGMMALLTL